MVTGQTATFTANGALAAHVRVKVTSASTTNPIQVEVAGAGEQHIGITEYAAATGTPVSVRLRAHDGTIKAIAAEVLAVGAVLYGAAAGKVKDTSDGSAIGVALEAATADGDVIDIAEFAVLSTTAATVSIADAGTFTATETVEAALAEIYQDALTARGIIQIPTPAFDSAGVALAAFSSADAVTCGYCVTAKGLGIRWNNHATPGPAVGSKFMVPPDADTTADMTLHVLAAKVGATVGDAVTFTVGAYNNVVDAAYDADNDFGGATSAMVGNDTTKHVQHVTLTLAAANLAAYPACTEITIKPTNGLLGTDDVILLAAWIEYKRKLRTA